MGHNQIITQAVYESFGSLWSKDLHFTKFGENKKVVHNYLLDNWLAIYFFERDGVFNISLMYRGNNNKNKSHVTFNYSASELNLVQMTQALKSLRLQAEKVFQKRVDAIR
jgi:hypothetical protein